MGKSRRKCFKIVMFRAAEVDKDRKSILSFGHVGLPRDPHKVASEGGVSLGDPSHAHARAGLVITCRAPR